MIEGGGDDYGRTEDTALTGVAEQRQSTEGAGMQSVSIECAECGATCSATLHVGLSLGYDGDQAVARVSSALVDLIGCEHAAGFLTAYREG